MNDFNIDPYLQEIILTEGWETGIGPVATVYPTGRVMYAREAIDAFLGAGATAPVACAEDDAEQDRALSLREGAILQGFPETYSFVPEARHRWGVPPNGGAQCQDRSYTPTEGTP